MQLLGRAKFLMEEENPKRKVKFLKGGANFLKEGEIPRNFAMGQRLAHANSDKLKLRRSMKGLQQGVEKFLFSTQWLNRQIKLSN
jgi:hypothetical protein